MVKLSYVFLLGGIKMSIDWKKEAENRKDEMLADLKTMLEIESVRDESKGTPEARQIIWVR